MTREMWLLKLSRIIHRLPNHSLALDSELLEAYRERESLLDKLWKASGIPQSLLCLPPSTKFKVSYDHQPGDNFITMRTSILWGDKDED